jgi:hypothetical protein
MTSAFVYGASHNSRYLCAPFIAEEVSVMDNTTSPSSCLGSAEELKGIHIKHGYTPYLLQDRVSRGSYIRRIVQTDIPKRPVHCGNDSTVGSRKGEGGE